MSKVINFKNQGLTSQEAQKRLQKFGPNEIRRGKRVHPIKILLNQFSSPLVILLIVSAIISWLIGYLPGQSPNLTDSVLILAIVFVAGIAGFIQDYKAEKSIEALQKMTAPRAKVIRDGEEKEIKASELVPGDLIFLTAGDIVPADAKIIKAFNLKVNEAVLTGESGAIEKKLNQEVFMNSYVYVGEGQAVVLRTGMRTKMGQVASRLQKIKEEKTSLQKEITTFSRKIFWAILTIAFLIFLISLTKYNLYQSALGSISLAVAAIPEGLPAVIVLTLALGAGAMVKRKALIRRLAIVESVGAVDVICSDKTGTLTKNEMETVKLFFDNKIARIEEKIKHNQTVRLLLTCGFLCNNAKIFTDVNGKKRYLGDPTEVALKKSADKLGLTGELLRKYQKIDENPFTSERKMMSTLYKTDHSFYLFAKGAPEVLLEHCSFIFEEGKIKKLTFKKRQEILLQNQHFAQQALRVLGFAFKKGKEREKVEKEEGLIWLGLQAMTDPVREEVILAIKECQTAGIRVMMLTGDNPTTAKAVADQIGLKSSGVLLGKQLDKMSNSELEQKIAQGVNIFARISPFHKLRILKILQKKYRVAMTGDGVNDSLALKKADVGIAMGVKGTEVAKQASDIILLDDNFATIVSAIKEGRRIFVKGY